MYYHFTILLPLNLLTFSGLTLEMFPLHSRLRYAITISVVFCRYICHCQSNKVLSNWQSISTVEPLYNRHLWIKDTSLQETLLLSHFQHFDIMLNDPSTKDTSIKRTSLLVPMVSVIEEGFHCIFVVNNLCSFFILRQMMPVHWAYHQFIISPKTLII